MIHLIFLFDIIILFYCVFVFAKTLFIRKYTIYSYKIINLSVSVSVIFMYMIFFVIIVYYYRILNIGNHADLFLLYTYLKIYISCNIPLIFKAYIGLCISLLFVLLLLFVLNIHKYCFAEIYNLYLYMNYKNFFANNVYTTKCYLLLENISNDNLINYIFIKIAYYYTTFWEAFEKSHQKSVRKQNYVFSRFLWFIANHRFYNIRNIKTSDICIYYLIPWLLIIYDCIFNAFILKHIFYYIPFYIPIIFLHRITKTIGHNESNMQNLIWEILYKKETNVIYACTSEQKLIFDYFLNNGLKIPLELPGDLNRVFLSQELYLLDNSPLRFESVDINNNNYQFYRNDFGLYMQKLSDGDLYIVEDFILDDTLLFEGEKPYIILGDKLVEILNKTSDHVFIIEENISPNNISSNFAICFWVTTICTTICIYFQDYDFLLDILNMQYLDDIFSIQYPNIFLDKDKITYLCEYAKTIIFNLNYLSMEQKLTLLSYINYDNIDIMTIEELKQYVHNIVNKGIKEPHEEILAGNSYPWKFIACITIIYALILALK